MSRARPPRGSFTPVRIYYSYEPADEALSLELEKHLSPLQQQGLIQGWHRRIACAGEPWAETQRYQLEQAELVLLLVSADSLATAQQEEDEIDQVLTRHRARVIAILLKPCDWRSTPFADLVVLPRNQRPVTSWPDRDAAWAEVAGEIRRAIERLRGVTPRAVPHFVGPTEPPHDIVAYKRVRIAIAGAGLGLVLGGVGLGMSRYLGVTRSTLKTPADAVSAQHLSLAQFEAEFQCPAGKSCRITVTVLGDRGPEQRIMIQQLDAETGLPMAKVLTTRSQVRAWWDEALRSPPVSVVMLAIAGALGQTLPSIGVAVGGGAAPVKLATDAALASASVSTAEHHREEPSLHLQRKKTAAPTADSPSDPSVVFLRRPALLMQAQKRSGEDPRLPDAVKAKNAGSTLRGSYQLCVATSGRVSSVSPVEGIAGADASIMATLRTWTFESQAVPVCTEWVLRYVVEEPSGDPAIRTLVKPSENQYQFVATPRFRSQKLSGEDPHLPDDVKLGRSGQTIQASYKLCIGIDGKVADAEMMIGIPGADENIRKALLTWLFKPQPIPTCMIWVLQFIVS